jgi:uncharacterized protein
LSGARRKRFLRYPRQVTCFSNPPTSFRLIVDGNGKIGFMKGDGLLNLTPNGEGAAVAYEGDVQVGGTIAAVGQRLLDTTSKMIIKRFFTKLATLAEDSAKP